MGCDIHTVTEVRTGHGWEAVLTDAPVFQWRTYGMFGFLADVRNYSEVPCLWAGRGWPEDCTETAAALRERWAMDGHSYTWVSLAELQGFDYDQPMEDRRCVEVMNNCWNGGCTTESGAGTQTTYRAFLGPAFFDELERLSGLGIENVRVLMLFES